MEYNYFFVDGSALLSDIRKARTTLGLPASAIFDIPRFVSYFTSARFNEFHGGAFKRFVLYFVQDDERLRSTVNLPDFAQPGTISDLHIEFCGKRIKQFEQAKEWLDQNNAPEVVRESLYRSEKAIDTQICCDALQLLAIGKLERLFLYTNDYDYVPLCQTLRRMGANINLFRIYADTVNVALVSECDAFNVMDNEGLRASFILPESTDQASKPPELAS